MLIALPLLTAGAFAQSSPAPGTIQGRARIVDGDTLEIGVHRIRLYGIDAPEPDQLCQRDGRPWRCGSEATFAMAALIETHWLTCHQRDRTPAGELLAVCRMGGPKGQNVNRAALNLGHGYHANAARQIHALGPADYFETTTIAGRTRRSLSK